MDSLAPADAASFAAASHLSMIGLFLQADPVVKGAMGLLVLASIACWAVILDKTVRLLRARREAAAFEARLRTDSVGPGMGAALATSGSSGIAASILTAGLREWRDGGNGVAGSGMHETRGERRERIERAMRMVVVGELRRLERGLPLLATVGSAAPFVGLFGTVWGIMNSFQSIAQSQDTSLAVVAPGIAEALFATAIGLVAAIPAVIGYNKLATELSRLGQRLAAAIGDLGGRLARQPAAAVVAATPTAAAPKYEEAAE